MASPELGTKQICPNCQTKFYDLTRRPAHCPKCGMDFDPEDALRSRRTRARVSPAEIADDDVAEAPVRDEADDQEEEEATPEIDEAADEAVVAPDEDEAGEPGAVPADDADFPADDEPDAEEAVEDVPFLEESEDDDLADEPIEGLPGEDEEDR